MVLGVSAWMGAGRMNEGCCGFDSADRVYEYIHKITEGVEGQVITYCSSQYDTPIKLQGRMFKTDRRKVL